MLPRQAADYRTLFWAFVLMPGTLIALLANPKLLPYLAPLSTYLAIAAGTIAHNHNHCPTFANKRVNAFFGNWISIFYGYPSFAWIPTHNLNHHRHVNREGDATITWRYSNRNTLWIALSFFFVSAYWQKFPIGEYIKKAKAGNPRLYRQIVTQYVLWGSSAVVLMALAVTMHGWKTGLTVFFFAYVLPSFMGPWTMMWFNYMQHVHADPWSKRNHSRNITGRVFNFLVFNNGLHTVHHDNAGAHWSTAYEAHAKIAHEIHPDLNWRSFWWWIIRGYLVPVFVPSLETKQIGRAPFDPPPTAKPARRTQDDGRPAIDSVDALEAGSNAQMA
jgi:beta-carotene hydroxylase